ncbi:MAG: nuclear transport factor 2 family protein [Verrucomicrobiales bacterium]
MIQIVVRLLVLCAAALMISCGEKNAPPPPPDPAIEDVRAFLTKYFQVWSEKRIDAYQDLFEKGAVVHFVDESGRVVAWPLPPFIESQRQAHAAAVAPMVETAERMEIHISPDSRAAQAAVKWKLVEGDKVTIGWDHFTLLRRDNRWFILNLVFYKE